jgi:hypothetical protein
VTARLARRAEALDSLALIGRPPSLLATPVLTSGFPESGRGYWSDARLSTQLRVRMLVAGTTSLLGLGANDPVK